MLDAAGDPAPQRHRPSPRSTTSRPNRRSSKSPERVGTRISRSKARQTQGAAPSGVPGTGEEASKSGIRTIVGAYTESSTPGWRNGLSGVSSIGSLTGGPPLNIPLSASTAYSHKKTGNFPVGRGSGVPPLPPPHEEKQGKEFSARGEKGNKLHDGTFQRNVCMDTSVNETDDRGAGTRLENLQNSDGNGSGADVQCVVLERRLQKAITANAKWQQKYRVETEANEELGRRVRSWKTAYLREVNKQDVLKAEIANVRKAAELQAESLRQEIRRLACLVLRSPEEQTKRFHTKNNTSSTSELGNTAAVKSVGADKENEDDGGVALSPNWNRVLESARGRKAVSSIGNSPDQSSSDTSPEQSPRPGRGKRPPNVQTRQPLLADSISGGDRTVGTREKRSYTQSQPKNTFCHVKPDSAADPHTPPGVRMTHNVETARPGDEGHRESRTSSSCHVEATDVEDVGRGATETAERGTAVSNIVPRNRAPGWKNFEADRSRRTDKTQEGQHKIRWKNDDTLELCVNGTPNRYSNNAGVSRLRLALQTVLPLQPQQAPTTASPCAKGKRVAEMPAVSPVASASSAPAASPTLPIPTSDERAAPPMLQTSTCVYVADKIAVINTKLGESRSKAISQANDLNATLSKAGRAAGGRGGGSGDSEGGRFSGGERESGDSGGASVSCGDRRETAPPSKWMRDEMTAGREWQLLEWSGTVGATSTTTTTNAAANNISNNVSRSISNNDDNDDDEAEPQSCRPNSSISTSSSSLRSSSSSTVLPDQSSKHPGVSGGLRNGVEGVQQKGRDHSHGKSLNEEPLRIVDRDVIVTLSGAESRDDQSRSNNSCASSAGIGLGKGGETSGMKVVGLPTEKAAKTCRPINIGGFCSGSETSHRHVAIHEETNGKNVIFENTDGHSANYRRDRPFEAYQTCHDELSSGNVSDVSNENDINADDSYRRQSSLNSNGSHNNQIDDSDEFETSVEHRRKDRGPRSAGNYFSLSSDDGDSSAHLPESAASSRVASKRNSTEPPKNPKPSVFSSTAELIGSPFCSGSADTTSGVQSNTHCVFFSVDHDAEARSNRLSVSNRANACEKSSQWSSDRTIKEPEDQHQHPHRQGQGQQQQQQQQQQPRMRELFYSTMNSSSSSSNRSSTGGTTSNSSISANTSCGFEQIGNDATMDVDGEQGDSSGSVSSLRSEALTVDTAGEGSMYSMDPRSPDNVYPFEPAEGPDEFLRLDTETHEETTSEISRILGGAELLASAASAARRADVGLVPTIEERPATPGGGVVAGTSVDRGSNDAVSRYGGDGEDDEEGDDRCGDPKLFESFLSIGVPPHWDLASFVTAKAAASPSCKRSVHRRKGEKKSLSGVKWVRSMLSGGVRSPQPAAVRLQEGASSDGSSTACNIDATGSKRMEGTVGGEAAVVRLHLGGRTIWSDGKLRVHQSVEGCLEPQVLACYPPEAALPCQNVADYCFPEGINATAIDTRASRSSLNKVLFQPGACQRGSQSFVFMFSGDHGCRGEGAVQNHRTYGVCVTYPKVLRDVKSATTPTTESVSGGSVAATSETSGKQPEGISVRTGRGLRASIGGNSSIGVDVQVWGCYCLLSRFPFFDLHFQVLWDLLAAERIMRMQMAAQRTGRLSREDEVIENGALARRVEDLLESVARRYMGLRVPAPGCSVQLTVHPELPEIRYRRGNPAGNEGDQLAHGPRLSSGSELGRIISYDTFAGLRGSGIPQHVVDVREMVDSVAAWALPGTLSSIPAEILVTLIGALMCECQVIVVSQDLGLLSSTVLALAALTRPLLWVHPLVPVMPVDMGEVLSAPVPYLIGIPSLERGTSCSAVQLNAGQVLLNADGKTVTFGRAVDIIRTRLPRARSLVARLAPLAKVLSESCRVVKKETPLHLTSGSQTAAAEIAQATVAAHISTICAAALEHRDDIIHITATTATDTYTNAGSPTGSYAASDVMNLWESIRATGTITSKNAREGTEGEGRKEEQGIAFDDEEECLLNDVDDETTESVLDDQISGGTRWIRRHERDAPFLRQFVCSQAFEVYRAAAVGAEEEMTKVGRTTN